ncbi:type I restriction endonuclease subunit R [Planctomycetota bacterium]|nr:type I restriction endonuclease subunit R [Planctomycetota bacterium]
MKFTESQLEQAVIELMTQEGYPHVHGDEIERLPDEVLILDDLRRFLEKKFAASGITASEIESIIKMISTLPASQLYDSNKTFMKMVSDGFTFNREDASQKDLYIQLLDFDEPKNNVFKMVNQLEIIGDQKRIPDGILYINGLPLIVFEFKSAIRPNATIHHAYTQLTTRYRRDIPKLFVYNAISVISDGVNSKAGSFFAPYEFFYAWRKVTGDEKIEKDGIDSLYTLVRGMFNKNRMLDIIQNFIYFPDVSRKEEKILCRYPQYYAARKLYINIKKHQKPEGNGKGGTYFGATGCGKSFTMQFLSRLLMKCVDFASPTIVLITDRTDLDDQLSKQFTNAKGYIGDQNVISVDSREHLKELLRGRNSGGVFLTTIHKFSEDTDLLTARSNVICISDEAHRSQHNLEQKVRQTKEGIKKSYGFAKHLHDSLPNATYVGFTGTPIDETLKVFGEVVDAYKMAESVRDDITVRIVYEGRAAKVLLDNEKLQEIEAYYAQCAEEGANEYQIEESKKANANMNAILGDDDRIAAVAEDFVKHYEARITEGASVKGKAMFVCSSRPIAYKLFKKIVELRPQWDEILTCEPGAELSDKEQKEVLPIERVKMVMTRGKDDTVDLYEKLGTKDYRKELDRQFKNEKSNFKIAIVVDMWLTGFDVPFLDTMYIDKPVQRHNLIQTISRVNRKYGQKEKGLIVDYLGIKKQMNKALADHHKVDEDENFEGIEDSVKVVKDSLSILEQIFHKFDARPYFQGSPLEQMDCLNRAAEFVQLTQKLEVRFMRRARILKAAYDICTGSDDLCDLEKDHIYFYLAVRSIVFKLTKGDAPDTAQMNTKVRQMIEDALHSDGVEEIMKMGKQENNEVDLFSEDYLAKIEKIKLPNTKIKLLQQLLTKSIDEFRKINKVKGVDFTKQFKAIVEKYNERSEQDVLRSEVLEDFTNEIIELYHSLKEEKESFSELGIDFEEKAFYDILKAISIKFDFPYPKEKMLDLAKEVKKIVDDKAKYTDWANRTDIKFELKADLIVLLANYGYPPISHDEAYREIFEQAENFKKYQTIKN